MARSLLFRGVLLAAALCSAVNAKYALHHHYSPKKFFDGFDFYTGADPTNGFVQYVDRNTAHANKLISTHKHHVRIGVDHTNVYPVGGAGRPSVRIESKKSYNHGLFVLSLNHMPYGCGAWPAFWTLGPNWPYQGEIDVIEGVNTNVYNIVTLHSGPDCSIAGERQTGTLLTNNCTSSPNSNYGCGIQDSSSASYGAGFNNAHGGYYVLEWTPRGIKTWSFTKYNVPHSIRNGHPNPAEFGQPSSNFAGSCNFESSFRDHKLIFDVTFCGDYAGNTYSMSSCPNAGGGYAACNDYVANNPAGFRDAYWSINSLKVYKKQVSHKKGAAVNVASEKKHKPAHSTQPVAATSKIISESLRFAGMGVPAAVTRTLDQSPRTLIKKTLAEATLAA